MVKLKTIVLLCLLLMFGKPLYAYTGVAYSFPLNLYPTQKHEGYRVDLGLYQIGESPLNFSVGFGEYRWLGFKNDYYEHFDVKAIHIPIYFAVGPERRLFIGLNTNYWHSVDIQLKRPSAHEFHDQTHHKFQIPELFDGYIFKYVTPTGNGGFFVGIVSLNSFKHARSGLSEPAVANFGTVGLGYYFK